jgi:hypothetical protein
MLDDLVVEAFYEKLTGGILEQVSEPTRPKTDEQATAQVQSQALQGVGKAQLGTEQRRLQEVLPEIRDVAQKVGSMKNLADFAGNLDQGKK